MKRISVDIGGTFTDCFFVWDDRYVEAKALTTHHNLALGFNETRHSTWPASGPTSTGSPCCPRWTRCGTPRPWAPTP